MYVRIQASFFCICKLAVNVQNIHKSPALLFLIWNITFVLVSSITENVELVSFVFVLESAVLEVLQFAYFYAKGVVLRNKH